MVDGQPNCVSRFLLPSQPSQTLISHILLCASCIILIIFSLVSGIVLSVINAKYSGLAGIDGLNAIIMVTAIILSVLAVGAMLSSWRRITCYLNLYEFVCLLAFIVFLLLLIAVCMSGISNYQSSPNTQSNPNNLVRNCYTPSNYFQFKMLQVSNKAQNLLCSETCPCPKYNKVQQCSGWQSNPYQLIMEQMQEQFDCSGWCNFNKKNFMFRDNLQEVQIKGPCHDQWVKWLKSQWKAVIACIAVMLFIFLINVVLTNWRILKIWNKDDEC